MAGEVRVCVHPRVKVIARWVEPDTVTPTSCYQWFQCEACGKHWREQRTTPLPRGSRLSDAPRPDELQAHLRLDDGKLHLRWQWIVGVIFVQSLVLAAMLWFIFASFH